MFRKSALRVAVLAGLIGAAVVPQLNGTVGGCFTCGLTDEAPGPMCVSGSGWTYCTDVPPMWQTPGLLDLSTCETSGDCCMFNFQ